MAKSRKVIREIFEEDGLIFKRKKKAYQDPAIALPETNKYKDESQHLKEGVHAIIDQVTTDENHAAESSRHNNEPDVEASLQGLSDESRLLITAKKACRLELMRVREEFGKDRDVLTVLEVLLKEFVDVVHDSTVGVSSLITECASRPSKRKQWKLKLDILGRTKRVFEAEEAQWKEEFEKLDSWKKSSEDALAKGSNSMTSFSEENSDLLQKLREGCSTMHDSLALQVEGQRAMVEGIESMCNRGENMCNILAKDLLCDMLPSSRSPVGLIRQLAAESPSPL